MNNVDWLERPLPYDDESLAGFLSRWARANALPSRRYMLQCLDVPHAVRLEPGPLQRVAAAMGVQQEVLEALAPATEPSRPALRRSLTRARNEAACPLCLAQVPYSRQLWSHGLATACPEHGTRLIDRCGRCRQPLAHDRWSVHTCDCGADLRLVPTQPALPEEVELARMLTGRIPEHPVLPFSMQAGLPPDIDLFFLGLANHFCGSRAGIPGAKPGKGTMPSSVEAALALLMPVFELLHDWPRAFDSRLAMLIAQAPAASTTGVSKRLGSWYGLLFRQSPHLAFEPLRVAAANRITQSMDGVLNARTSNVQSIATVCKEWYTVAEVERDLGVSAERLNEGIDSGLIEARRYDQAAGYRQRLLARTEIERLRSIQAQHIDDTTARQLLNVSKVVFSLANEAGWIERSDPATTPPVTRGLVQRDALMALMQRLRDAAIQDPVRSRQDTVALQELTLRRTTDRQRLVAVYRAILQGELQAVGHEGEGLAGLQFLRSEVDTRIASRVVARGLTVQQVSELTGAHYDAVRGWVEGGLLPASREAGAQGAPWVIEFQVLVVFLMQYAPLARLSADSDTSSRGLSSALGGHGVPVIETSTGRGSLVKLADLACALKRIAKPPAAAGRKGSDGAQAPAGLRPLPPSESLPAMSA